MPTAWELAHDCVHGQYAISILTNGLANERGMISAEIRVRSAQVGRSDDAAIRASTSKRY
jgi:hypothetical protein